LPGRRAGRCAIFPQILPGCSIVADQPDQAPCDEGREQYHHVAVTSAVPA